MDEVIEFLRVFTKAECVAMKAHYAEPDDAKAIAIVREWDKMFGGGLRSGLSRPAEPPELYSTPDYVEAGARQRPRSIFAVAHYKRGTSDLYRAWLGDTELGRRGEGIPENFYVEKDNGALKVTAIYKVCTNCMGSAKTKDGGDCPECEGGWLYRRGTHVKRLGVVHEVKKLQAPSDALYKPAYDAIEEPK